MYSFSRLSSYSLRHNLFIEYQENYDRSLNISQHCETRWVSKYKGIHFFKIRLKCVLDALKNVL